MRAAISLVLALMMVVLALPSELLPSVAQWRIAWNAPMWFWPLLVASVLAGAGLLLPRATLAPQTLDLTGLTVAMLLILEPLLHLLVLAVTSVVPTMAGAHALLPLSPPMFNSTFLGHALVFVLAVPIGEEFFFRGRLLPWFQQRLGNGSAVSLSAGLFAVAHGDLMQVLIALPVGLLLGVMRVGGASLGACIIAHAVHNGLFLAAGPGLIGLPIAAPILAMTGVGLVAVAWFFHLRPRPGQWQRCVFAICLGWALLGALAPWWRQWQDGVWARGVHRLCQQWRIGTGDLLARLVAQERVGRMTTHRREQLVEMLLQRPCQTADRQVGILGLLAPYALATVPEGEDAAHVLFDHLAHQAPPRYDGDVARRLAMVVPGAFADAVLQWPELLPRWLPLPARTADTALILAACTSPRDRRVLMTQLEVCYPGRVAAVIVLVPAAYLTAQEARHLRRHYPDASERIAILAVDDPQRARALGWDG